MNQYCRYCSYCIYGDAVWCEKKMKVISENTAKRVNHCKDFEFNESDCFDLTKTYKPKEKKDRTFEQLKLF